MNERDRSYSLHVPYESLRVQDQKCTAVTFGPGAYLGRSGMVVDLGSPRILHAFLGARTQRGQALYFALAT